MASKHETEDNLHLKEEDDDIPHVDKQEPTVLPPKPESNVVQSFVLPSNFADTIDSGILMLGKLLKRKIDAEEIQATNFSVNLIKVVNKYLKVKIDSPIVPLAFSTLVLVAILSKAPKIEEKK